MTKGKGIDIALCDVGFVPFAVCRYVSRGCLGSKH